MKIEVHVIQSVPTSRLNADRGGRPKTIVYGGFKRARLSSQSQKRAARLYTHGFGLIGEEQRAYRTRLFAERVIAALTDAKTDEAAAELLVKKAFSAIGMALNNQGQNEYLLLHSQREFDGFVQAIRKHQRALSNVKINFDQSGRSEDRPDPDDAATRTKKKRKRLFPPEVSGELEAPFLRQRTLELALYGRHLADLPEGTVDGQVQVMHAMSVHAVLDESDFFVAVDDYQPASQPAAGMLGEIGISAPTFYRMAAVNTSRLAVEVDDPEAALVGARAFIEAFVMSLPSSGRNPFSAQTPPTFVLLQRVEQGEALNLAPAFERPLTTPPTKSMAGSAVAALEEHLRRVETAYPRLRDRRRVCVNLTDHAVTIAPVLADLDQAIAQILA